MTKYRKARQRVAKELDRLTERLSQGHITIHKLLEWLEQENVTVWQKGALWLMRLYTRVLPRNASETMVAA